MIYYLFAGSTYYPLPGVRDLRERGESVEYLRGVGQGYDWWQITDADLNIVDEGVPAWGESAR